MRIRVETLGVDRALVRGACWPVDPRTGVSVVCLRACEIAQRQAEGVQP
jgi:hypothetical protein